MRNLCDPCLLIDSSALERTFLAYLRTSLAFAFVAIIIAQFFRLQHIEQPDAIIGYYVLSIPLAATCIIAGMIVLLLGFYRFWRQQSAMQRAKVFAGGWDINTVGCITFVVIVTLFLLSVAVDARKNAKANA